MDKASILVIDDEAIIREGCIKILSKEGCHVESVENGTAGLELVREKSFDLILLDLMMPGLSGIDVLNEVKIISPEIYIIIITGYATIETAVAAMKSGAYDYIPKPFTPDQLRMVVKKALDNRALLREAEFLRREKEKGLQAVAQEKSKIKTILNCIPNGLLVMDGDRKVVLYNPIAGKLLNIYGESILGVEVDKCVKCRDLPEMISDVLKGSGGEAVISGEIANEEAVPIMAHIAPVKMEEGEVVGAVAILQDISEQKAMDKIKANFISKVTHELKAPAATVNQLLMTILSGAVGELNEEQRTMIERTVQRGKGLLDLISDLLNISKIESGLAVQRKSPIQIKEVIEGVLDLLMPQADEKKIKINLNIDSNLPVIMADRDSMGEVFTNLISNAIKYTEANGEVNINGDTDRDYVRISVTDNGLGINEKDIPFIFERFFRVKNQKTRQITGTGLGLPIVKEIIDAHLGAIEVQSREGSGSTFRVLLPMKVS